MKNEFKAGDWVYELSTISEIKLTKLSTCDDWTYPVIGKVGDYTANGKEFDGAEGIPSLLHATLENRQALVTLYGEDAVPELPLQGSELTKKLLEKQKYVMCRVSSHSDDRAREWPQEICVVFAAKDEGFALGKGKFIKYAVPVDMNGNEITGIGG